jgi:ATP phosphoribosyltransferase
MCAAVPAESPYQSLDDLKDLRIATSFPGIVSGFYQKEMNLVVLEGAVEISVSLGVADAVVDVVETGTTLKQAGLRVLGAPLFVSNAALFAHPGHEGSPEVRTLTRRIEGKIVAMNYRMVEYDAPKSKLEEACRITPGLGSPTIAPLHDPDWVSVKAMVRADAAHAAMDSLEDLGCKGIVLSAIESARV